MATKPKPVRITAGDLRPGDTWRAASRADAVVEFVVPVPTPRVTDPDTKFVRVRSHDSHGWRSTWTVRADRTIHLVARGPEPERAIGKE